MTKSHICLVQSPLQIINAFEATSSLSNDQNIHYFIFFQKETQTNSQMLNTLKELSVKPHCIVSYNKNALLKVLTWFKIVFILSRIRDISRFYIGDYMAGQLVGIANLYPKADLFLLDDGTASYNFVNFRYKNISPQYLKASKKIPILCFNPFLPAKITFFSMYNIKLNSPDVLIKNKLSCFSNLITSSDFGPIFFIGCPLVEVKVISSDIYYEYMTRFFRHYCCQKVIYFPHRREILNQQKLDFLDSYSVEIYYQTLPFEIELIKIKTPPSMIISFFSSVFDTLSLIYGKTSDVLVSLRISTDLIEDTAYKQIANSSYVKYEKSENISIVDL
ncbi:alpha-2,8-polysialyltransferase family protein [bacterium]|nr:alpha-2,8-polysialyltransferase family protein [bacterium]